MKDQLITSSTYYRYLLLPAGLLLGGISLWLSVAIANVFAQAPSPQLRAQGVFIGMGGVSIRRVNASIAQPAETFTQRPDFYTTPLKTDVPESIRDLLIRPSYTWREVTP